MTRQEFTFILKHELKIRNVYFQPPPDIKIQYPCVIYSQATYDTQQADNHNYIIQDHYVLTTISKSSDWDVPKKLLRVFPSCKQESSYVSNGLYHKRFSVYI